MNSNPDNFKIQNNGENADIAETYAEKHPILQSANQILRSHLREPTKTIPFRWSYSVFGDREIIDINIIYPLVQAWCQLDVTVAESLLKSTFFLQDKDGTLATHYLPDGTPLTTEAPRPLLAQAVKTVWEAGKNRDFIKAILPRLYRYIEWIFYYFDPQRKGIPKWQSAGESLLPNSYSSRWATPDLTILLICEIEALKFLENECPEILTNTLDLGPELNRLNHDALELYFWDTNKSGVSIRDTVNDVRIETSLFYTLLLPMGTSISSELTIQAKPLLDDTLNNLGKFEILAAGGRRDLNSIYAFLLIAAVTNGGMQFAHRRFLHQLWKLIGHHFKKNQSLPKQLLFAPNAEEEPNIAKSSSETLTTAALISYIGNIILTSEPTPSLSLRTMRRLNLHPLLATLTPLALAGVTILILAGICAKRKTPVASDLEAGLALASQYYHRGDYEKALNICQCYTENTTYTTAPLIMKANILAHLEEYAQAEKLYRALLDKNGATLSSELNLALVVYRQGRLKEAIALYTEFINTYGPNFPEESKHATLAIKLIKEHGVKKRGRQDTSRRSG